jgi:glutamate dehydrogenase (NADP+)
MLKAAGQSLKGKTVVVSGSGNVAIYTVEKAQQNGAKVITMSDSNGYILDEAGIDIELMKQIKEVERARIEVYAERKPGAKYFPGEKVWGVPCDIALPCATQNDIGIEEAKKLVENGVMAVGEGANMPCTIEADKYFLSKGVLVGPAKAANAGGVSVSALEMSQNSERLEWTFEEVDQRQEQIMINIFKACSDAAKEFGMEGNYIAGANIAGFLRVAKAMKAQGTV